MGYEELITTMDKEDRDLLIKLSAKMDLLCKTANENNQDNKDTHKEIINKIDDNFRKTTIWVENVHERIDEQIKGTTQRVDSYNKTFLQSKTFYWVVGFIIAGLISAWASIAYFGTEVKIVKKDHSTFEKAMEHYHPDYLKLH